MNITEMFSDSYISYPFSNSNRILGLGLLFCSAVFLIVPAVFAAGYIMRIIENTIEGDYELPPFENWKGMFIDGLKVAAVVIFFILPGLISEFALFVLVQSGYALTNPWLMIGLFILTSLFYISAYIVSITAIPRMAYKNQLKAAFEFKKVLKDIKCIGLRKYALSLTGLSIMVAYLILFAGVLHEVFYSIGVLISLNVYITDFTANLMIYPLIIASQGRFMGLIYLERFQSPD
jgi:hypothetical protein